MREESEGQVDKRGGRAKQSGIPQHGNRRWEIRWKRTMKTSVCNKDFEVGVASIKIY